MPADLSDNPSVPPDAAAVVAAGRPAAVTVRSGVVECLHHGVGAAVRLPAGAGDHEPGDVVARLGEDSWVLLPRSALKLLHAVAFLEVGLDVDDELLAIVCASHSGEAGHLGVVRRLLAHAGLSVEDLRGTPDLPLDAEAAFAWRAGGGTACALTQNCSGNHAGMLAASVAAGWEPAGYTAADHPVQRAIAATTARLAGGVSPVVAVDGCGAPAFGTTVAGLARAYAAIAGAPTGTPEARVRDAVLAHPWLVGGTGRRNTVLMGALPGVAVKDGADGVIAAGWAGSDGSGVGVAVKVLDGADRARGVLLGEGMRRAGLDVPTSTPGVTDPVLGHGEPVGAVVALPWG
ncbi:asparaginase [Aquipuribacter sp. MA13-6]|uniref:asparaginase n=1 Tax=unclassified Aquipuribacter TaxID=2635084 RepID=UPI003EE8395D